LAAALPSSAIGCEKSDSGEVLLEVAVARAIDGVAEKVLKLKGDAASVEKELQKLDRAVMKRLHEGLDTGALTTLKASVEESLTDLPERLVDETRDATLELLLQRRLRQLASLPVLSLFLVESRDPDTPD
jgi:hypothetical protein